MVPVPVRRRPRRPPGARDPPRARVPRRALGRGARGLGAVALEGRDRPRRDRRNAPTRRRRGGPAPHVAIAHGGRAAHDPPGARRAGPGSSGSTTCRRRRCREAPRAPGRGRGRVEDRRGAARPGRGSGASPGARVWTTTGPVATGSSSASPTPCSRRAVTRGPSPITARSRSWGCTASRGRISRPTTGGSLWFRRRGLTEHDVVRNDTFAVLRAGTERPWGVAVVCGYGTNCSGIGPDGRSFRFPAFGEISGDWGGGQDIGGPPSGTPRGRRTAGASRPRSGNWSRGTSASRASGSSPRRCISTGSSATRRRAHAGRVPRCEEGRRDRAWDRRSASAGDRADGRGRDPPAADDAARCGRRARRRGLPAGDRGFLDRVEGGIDEVAPNARVRVLDVPPVGAALLGSTGSRRCPRPSAAPGRRWRPPGWAHDGPDGGTRRDDLMAKIVFEGVTKEFGGEVIAVDDLAGDRRRRVHGPRRSVGVREVDDPPTARGPRGGDGRRDLDRRRPGDRPEPQGTRRRDGLPELRAVPAHDGRAEHRVRPEAAPRRQGRTDAARARSRRSWRSSTSSNASRPRSAGSDSGWRWGGR